MDLGKLASAFTGSDNPTRIRFGKITAVGSDHTVTVTIAGSTTAIASVKYLASNAPQIGAVCILVTDGIDIFVLDHVASGGMTLAPRISRSTNQSIPDSTGTPISFDGAQGDAWGCWSAGSPTLVTAPISGRFMAVGYVQFAANGTGIRTAYIEKNGTTTLAGDQRAPASGASPTMIGITAHAVDMIQGDYLRLMVYQTSGGALNCLNASTFAPGLSLIYLGP